MWRRKSWRFYFGIPQLRFYFHGPRPFPRKEDYLRMLQEYKEELEEELREVEKEIKEVGGST